MAEVHHTELKDTHPGHLHSYPPPPRLQGLEGHPKPHLGPNFDAYKREWEKSVGPDSDKWWAEKARECLSWFSDFKTVSAGGFENGDIQWL